MYGSNKSMQYALSLTGATVVMTSDVLVADAAATIAALTITLPPAPVRGQEATICFLQSVTAVTLGGGTILGAITGAALNDVVTYIYNDDLRKWIRSTQPIQCGVAMAVTTAVNFNAGNTDTSIVVPLPSGCTRYLVNACRISGASGSLSTATCGLFTAAAGGGLAVVTGASAITVTTASENTANNAQALTISIGVSTQTLNAATLFFRVATAQGVAATGNVTLFITPVS